MSLCRSEQAGAGGGRQAGEWSGDGSGPEVGGGTSLVTEARY